MRASMMGHIEHMPSLDPVEDEAPKIEALSNGAIKNVMLGSTDVDVLMELMRLA